MTMEKIEMYFFCISNSYDQKIAFELTISGFKTFNQA